MKGKLGKKRSSSKFSRTSEGAHQKSGKRYVEATSTRVEEGLGRETSRGWRDSL